MNERPRLSRFRILTIPTVAVLVMLWLISPARQVAAHAEPDRAEPPINGTVATAPAKLEIWFTEEVDPETVAVTVRAPDGSSADLGDAAVDLFDPERRHVTVSLRPGLPAGNYVVSWHTQSTTDGDAADGFFSFFVEQGASASPVASPMASGGQASAVASPIASPRAVTAASSPAAAVSTTAPAVATVAPGPTVTPVNEVTGSTEDFDSRAFGIAVGVGILVAIGLFLFWRLVRPKPGERQPPV